MDVPDFVDASLLFIPDDSMFTPGAYMSTQFPTDDMLASASNSSIAPTVSALVALAGELLQASYVGPSLPAPVTTMTPASFAIVLTASFNMQFFSPDNAIMTTAGMFGYFSTCSATYSIPERISERAPSPLSSRTFTGTKLAPLATPYVIPPTVPAT